MRSVLFIHHTFPGLTATFVYREAKALERCGTALEHLALRRPRSEAVSAEARGFLDRTRYAEGIARPLFWAKVVGGFLRAPGRTLGIFAKLLATPRTGGRGTARAILNLARGLYAAQFAGSRRRIGHIHAPFSTDVATIAMVASEVAGVPWSFSSHTAFDDRHLNEKVRSARFVRSISGFDRDRLIARTDGRHGGKIHVVHCGVEPGEWRFAPKARTAEPPMVFSVGTLQEKKGHAVLIEAMRGLADRGAGAKLVIAGGGDLREELRRKIDELGPAQQVELVGALPNEEVRALYDRADVFALASIVARNGDLDGIPVVLMEAMAHGIPCVSTRVSGIPELIEDGREGVLAEPGDCAGIARGIERLLSDAALRETVARNARRKIENEFNLERNAAKLAELFRQELAKRQRPRSVPVVKRPKVAFVTPLPTPYRQPLLERLTAMEDMEVTVFYCARGEADRSWSVGAGAGRKHRVLPGFHIAVGGEKTFYNHVNPGIWRELDAGGYDAVVTSGYALATSQIAIAWALFRRRPYLIHSESHHPADRAGWKRAAKRLSLRPILERAAGGFATGTLAKEYLVHYGVPRDRVWFLPNTTDVHGIAARVDALRGRRDAVRGALGIDRKFAAIFVGRLIPAKAPLDLLDAYQELRLARDDCALVIVGDGELEGELKRRIAQEGLAGAVLCGFKEGEELLGLYAAADLFILPSKQEPWGVVVNEAAAAGLPLLVSDAVGAGTDLVRSGENGVIFRAGDVRELARLWEGMLAREDLAAMGVESRRIVERWDYDFAVREFRAGVRSVL
ncbi:MAG: glycosyltransferase family 4 protein [Planctomycetota bacterium]